VGQVAAAYRESPPVFSRAPRHSDLELGNFKADCIGGTGDSKARYGNQLLMKGTKRNTLRPQKSERNEKVRQAAQPRKKKTIARRSPPWLRFHTDGDDAPLRSEGSGELFLNEGAPGTNPPKTHR
jgi:hypothetical protein